MWPLLGEPLSSSVCILCRQWISSRLLRWQPSHHLWPDVMTEEDGRVFAKLIGQVEVKKVGDKCAVDYDQVEGCGGDYGGRLRKEKPLVY